MSDFSARHGSDATGLETDRAIDRRQLLRAGAWAAPVIVLATSAPAAAASANPVPNSGSANVLASALAVDAYSLYDLNSGGTHGPLGWSGGQVGYWSAVSGIPVATFTWTVIVTKPDGTSVTVASGVANVAAGSALTIPQREVLPKPLASGQYKLTLSIFGSGGSTKLDVESTAIS